MTQLTDLRIRKAQPKNKPYTLSDGDGLALPSIVEVFYLIKQILAYTRATQGCISYFEISLSDRSDAARHAQAK